MVKRKITRSEKKTEVDAVPSDEVLDEVYDVERIVEKRETSKGTEYYVKWKGYPDTSNTWEPAGNILYPKLIKDFEANQGQKKVSPRKNAKRTIDEVHEDETGVEEISPDETIENSHADKISPNKKGSGKRIGRVPNNLPSAKVLASTPKLGVNALGMNGTPIRNNLRFSPSPQPVVSKPTRSKIGSKKISTKRASLGVAAKIARGRKAAAAAAVAVEATGTDVEKGDEGTFIVKRDDSIKPRKGGRTTKAQATSKAATPIVKKTAAATRRAAPAAKKAVNSRKNNEDDPKIDFKKFKFNRLINDSTSAKTITLLGSYNGENAVIKLEKTLFDDSAVKKALGDKDTAMNHDFSNDVYSRYFMNSSALALNKICATVVCPANETVLAKYSRADKIFFSETPDTYVKVVRPFIENKLADDPTYNNWVYNILDGISEKERVLFDDPDEKSGFVLTQNLKWSGDENDVDLLAICRRRDILSLRDLNDSHLILLTNISTKATKVIKEKFKKSKGQLRSFVHYHPSFYHFHVHFKMVDANDYETSDRDHLLGTVINNLTISKDYYKKSALIYPLPKSSELYKELLKAKRL